MDADTIDGVGVHHACNTVAEGVNGNTLGIYSSSMCASRMTCALCHACCWHASHRQSKLTAALRDAIGGNANTVMIANLWPEEAHLEECVSTLRFAARVRCLQTDAQVCVRVWEAAVLLPHGLVMWGVYACTIALRLGQSSVGPACSSQQGTYHRGCPTDDTEAELCCAAAAVLLLLLNTGERER
jgi:hypothetical protein